MTMNDIWKEQSVSISSSPCSHGYTLFIFMMWQYYMNLTLIVAMPKITYSH